MAALVNGNDAVGVIETVSAGQPAVRNLVVLHFQKLDVYQRAVEFLALTVRNIGEGCGRTSRADKARH